MKRPGATPRLILWRGLVDVMISAAPRRYRVAAMDTQGNHFCAKHSIVPGLKLCYLTNPSSYSPTEAEQINNIDIRKTKSSIGRSGSLQGGAPEHAYRQIRGSAAPAVPHSVPLPQRELSARNSGALVTQPTAADLRIVGGLWDRSLPGFLGYELIFIHHGYRPPPDELGTAWG